LPLQDDFYLGDSCTANAIALGARKLDTMQGHRHGVSGSTNTAASLLGVNTVPGGNFAAGTPLTVLDPITDGVHGTPRIGMETAGRFTAFHPRIHA
jgi:hypothetical protein